MPSEAEKELLLRVADCVDRNIENEDCHDGRNFVDICDITLSISEARTISRVLREAAEGWRPISEAKKDGTIIWAKLRDDIYPVLKPSRDDLLRWNGVQIPLRHPGVAEYGFDIGWGVAAPVGVGGFPDEWVEGFRPLPSPPSETGNG
jgi:hypothetical protein